MSEPYLYVVAFVVRSQFPVAQIGPEDVCFWHTTVLASDDHEAYNQGYRAFRAADAKALGISASVKTLALNDYVLPLLSLLESK